MHEAHSDRSWTPSPSRYFAHLSLANRFFSSPVGLCNMEGGGFEATAAQLKEGENGNPMGTWFSLLIMTVCQAGPWETTRSPGWPVPNKQGKGMRSSLQRPGSSHDSHTTCLYLYYYGAWEDVLCDNAPSLQPEDPTVPSFYVISYPGWSHVCTFLGPTVAKFLKDKDCVF